MSTTGVVPIKVMVSSTALTRSSALTGTVTFADTSMPSRLTVLNQRLGADPGDRVQVGNQSQLSHPLDQTVHRRAVGLHAV